MSTLCRTGAVAEGEWRVRCSGSSVSSSSAASPACPFSSLRSYLGFFEFATGDEGRHLRFTGGWGELGRWGAFRARWTDAWMSGQASRRCGNSPARGEPPENKGQHGVNEFCIRARTVARAPRCARYISRNGFIWDSCKMGVEVFVGTLRLASVRQRQRPSRRQFSRSRVVSHEPFSSVSSNLLY